MSYLTIDDLVESAQRGYALDDVQVNSIRVIAGEFAAAGYGPAMTMAAIANAYAESALYPNAVGDITHSHGSVGLFQLLKHCTGASPCNGAAGHLSDIEAPRPLAASPAGRPQDGVPASGDIRADPVVNTQIILGEVEGWKDRTREGSRSLSDLLSSGGSAEDLTKSFMHNVERPGGTPTNTTAMKAARRAAICRRMFPDWAELPNEALEWGSTPPRVGGSSWTRNAVAVVTLSILAFIAIYAFRRGARGFRFLPAPLPLPRFA